MSLRSWRRHVALLAVAVVGLGVLPGTAGAAGVRGTPTVRAIVFAAPEAGAPAAVEQLLNRVSAHITRRYSHLPGYVAEIPVAAMATLAHDPAVAAIGPDRREKLPPLPVLPRDESAPLLSNAAAATDATHPETSPLSLSLLHAADAWAMGITGRGVRVAIIDSGVDFTHPDLVGTAALDAYGQPLSVDFTSTDLRDTVGHATGVAGMIASQGRQVYQVADPGLPAVYSRIVGMAPDAKLMSAKIFDTRVPYEGGWDSWIIAALDWAIGNGAQIVNLSLGGGAVPEDGRDPLCLAVNAARSSGVLVLAAAGNEGGGDGTIGTPATAQGALAIGASTMYRSFTEIGYLAAPGKYTADQLAGFSSIAPTSDGRVKPYVLAPGAFDWSLAPMQASSEGSVFQLFGGTSQATPVAVGTMALLYQAYKLHHFFYPRPDSAQQLLVGTATDLGYPAALQGNGRIDAAAAVRAALGSSGVVSSVSEAGPRQLAAGSAGRYDLSLLNAADDPASVSVSASHLVFDDAATFTASGVADPAHMVTNVPVTVPAGYDLMDASVSWQSTDPGKRAPRLLLALYDPDGNFVNYQRPNVAGDQELGHMVQTRAARPAAGQWTARVALRLPTPTASLSFTLTVRFGRRAAWDWLTVNNPSLTLMGHASGNLRYRLAVPAGTPAGTYIGELDIVSGGHRQTLPVSVVVPVSLLRGSGTFSGTFSHGYQGNFNNGDWRYYTVHVPSGSPSLLTTLVWPDNNNAVEFYLVDPHGDVANAKANDLDVMQSGTTTVKAEQVAIANPPAGDWQIVVHSFAFYGGAAPEGFAGTVRIGAPLVDSSGMSLATTSGSSTTVTLRVSNPGVAPETVAAYGEGEGNQVQTLAGTATLSGVPNPDGSVTRQVLFGGVMVPPDTATLLTYVTWDNPNVNVAVELADPTWTSKDEAPGSGGIALVAHRHPWPGLWNAVVTFASPTSANQSTNIQAVAVLVAPPQLTGVTSPVLTIPPGGSMDLPVTIQGSATPGIQHGRILVLSVDGDILSSVPFTLRTF